MPTLLGIYTAIHVAISIAAIMAGIPAIAQMLRGDLRSVPILGFFSLTAATCLTGFGFPVSSLTPAHVVGVVTLAALSLSYYARSRALTSRSWRRVFLLAALASQYLNTFVLIVQAFQKIGFLHSLAPTQVEPPFIVAQFLGIALFLFPVWRTFTSTKTLAG